MLIRMRTTVIIEDGLLERAKKLAAETGQNVSQLVEQSLRDLLDRRVEAPRRPIRLPVYGGKKKVNLAPRDIWALTEADDVATARGRR
jgi:Ribbon-helix-helix protein, copG family